MNKCLPRFDVIIKHDELIAEVSTFLDDDLANLLTLLDIDIDNDPTHMTDRTVYVTEELVVEVTSVNEDGNRTNIKEYIN